MSYLDTNLNVLEWSSEEIVITYISPVDNRYHRYFPDFLVKTKRKDGSIITQILEIKPKYQTFEPERRDTKRTPTKQFINEVMTWGVNSAKWEAAKEYCLDRGWEFKILTEDHIFGPSSKKRHK